MTRPDDRSQEDYEQEVDEYIRRYRVALEKRMAWRLWRHEPMSLAIVITNLTEVNFTDIELTIHVPGAVTSWRDGVLDVVDDPERVRMPKRPAPLGTRKPNPFLAAAYSAPYVPVLNPTVKYQPDRGPSYRVRDGGSVDIDFSDIDLRPEQRLELDAVPLLVDAAAGTVLQCQWSATAGNVHRRVTGRFDLTVVESTFDYDAIDADEGPTSS